uniref:very-long-chain 3-oxoacyl-CoA synthase n=1 Tax=Ananas comosus var. bracteatus TaxID=296719 RepID=A0A6V7NST3_ANACO|nr:unnamed protein product [Ananas comosus var. bracteatus]
MEIAHKDYLLSSLLQLLNLLTLLVCLSIETFIFVHKCNPCTTSSPFLSPFFSAALSRPGNRPIFSTSRASNPRGGTACQSPASGAPLTHQLLRRRQRGLHDQSHHLLRHGQRDLLPPSLHYIPPSATHLDAMREVHMLLFPTLDDLFAKTRVRPLDVDALVINCSGFCPSPSLSAIVVNRYGMRHDVRSFNLSGMGCSAGVVGVDVARTLLSNINRRSYAIVMSTEIVSTGWYNGTDPRKLVLNCFFRMGCSAALVTNRGNKAAAGAAAGGRPAKYRLARLLRTHGAQEDRAYRSASREEDAEGSPDSRWSATSCGSPRSCCAGTRPPSPCRYSPGTRSCDLVPDFRAAVNHFCLPASGKPMIKKMAAGLGLREAEMEAALMTFHRFGNQSSASMWYQLAYLEAKKRVKKGERVWQLGWAAAPRPTPSSGTAAGASTRTRPPAGPGQTPSTATPLPRRRARLLTDPTDVQSIQLN